ncbi:hypothetical protein EYF80_050854 [Liparis tanakae]|uniref:Uncharacterized protein n=1 Tax=Liparis tanakae TaxID=230148 RepID=A0A4Z2FCT6_9TELE|nr:hypothetical protein EYF80_050854 [Liparis tanakae]
MGGDSSRLHIRRSFPDVFSTSISISTSTSTSILTVSMLCIGCRGVELYVRSLTTSRLAAFKVEDERWRTPALRLASNKSDSPAEESEERAQADCTNRASSAGVSPGGREMHGTPSIYVTHNATPADRAWKTPTERREACTTSLQALRKHIGPIGQASPSGFEKEIVQRPHSPTLHLKERLVLREEDEPGGWTSVRRCRRRLATDWCSGLRERGGGGGCLWERGRTGVGQGLRGNRGSVEFGPKLIKPCGAASTAALLTADTHLGKEPPRPLEQEDKGPPLGFNSVMEDVCDLEASTIPPMYRRVPVFIAFFEAANPKTMCHDDRPPLGSTWMRSSCE